MQHWPGSLHPIAQQPVLDCPSLLLRQALVEHRQLDEGAGLGLQHLAVLQVAPLAAGDPQRPGDQPWAGLGPVLGGGDGPVVALAPVPQELAELHSGRIQLVLQALHRVTVWEPLKYLVLLAKHQPPMVGFVTGCYGHHELDQR